MLKVIAYIALSFLLAMDIATMVHIFMEDARNILPILVLLGFAFLFLLGMDKLIEKMSEPEGELTQWAAVLTILLGIVAELSPMDSFSFAAIGIAWVGGVAYLYYLIKKNK